MENKKREIAKFYEQIFLDTKLKGKLEEKAKAIVNEEDLKNLIQHEIIPLMKKYNVNFSEKELLEYEEDTLKKLSKEDLDNVSGGVSIKSALLTGGLLSMALLGGVSLAPSIASAESGKGTLVQTGGNGQQQGDVDLGKCGENANSKFNERTGELTIYGTGDMYDFSENDSSWDKISDSIKSIVIEDGITSIGSNAFYCLPNLTQITIPKTVTEIGDSALICNRLEKVIYLGINDPKHSENPIFFTEQGVNFIVPLNYNGDTFCNEKVNKEDLTDNPYMQQSVRKRAVNLQLENSERQNLISKSDMNGYMQKKAEGKIALANDGNIFGCTLDPSGQGIILTDIYTEVVDGILVIPSKVTTQDGQVLNVTAISPNLFSEILENLETQNLIDESRENDYEQAKNENRIAIGGGHIFSYMLASSGNGVILTDIYTEVVDGILVIPPEVTTQDGQILPVVGIRGEKFRTSKIKVIKLSPLTKIFCFEGDAESAFFGNENIEIVDCSNAISLEYLEIGDSVFEDSSLKSIVAPPQEVKIVTGVNAYGSRAHYDENGKLTKKETLAPIAKYDIYSELSKPSVFFGFFKKASNTIIDKANYVLNKLKSIINFSCLKDDAEEYVDYYIKDDLNSVVGAIGSPELDSLEQSDCDLLVNAYNLLNLGDYDSQINVKPSKIGNNNNDSNNHGNDNDDNNGGFGVHDNNNNNNNDNDYGVFNDHSGNNNDNDNDDNHNNNQGPEEFVATNENNEASAQQSDNESQKIQAEARIESDSNNKAAASESEDNNDVVAKENSEASEEEIQAGVTDDDDDKSHKKISVDEFLARGSLSSDNEDDVAFVKRFITQNPVKDLENKINRETAQEIVKILDNFFGETFIGQGYNPDKGMVSNYMISLGSIFDVSIIESDEKNDNFSGSDDNRNYNDNSNDKDNSSDSSKHDDNDNDDDNDDDDTPKKLKTKKIKINSNKKRISSKTKSKTSVKTGNKKKINAKNSDIGLKNADNDNSKEPEVAAMPEESNNNALKQEVVATKEESNNNSQESKVVANQNDNSNNNAPSSNNKAAQPKETKEKAKDSATKTENSFSWKLTDDGILNISGSGPMPDFDGDVENFPWHKDRENIKGINISEGITAISAAAFVNFKNLVNVSFPKSLEAIGASAFHGCVNLVNINLPQSLKEIKYSAFEKCKSLTNVKLPGNLISLKDNAFKYCAGLTKISIPASVTSIGSDAFYNCNNLIEVALNSDAAVANFQNGFSACDHINKIILGKDVTSFDINNLENFKNLKEFAVAEENEKFEAVDGMLVFKDEQGSTLVCCPQGKTGSITVPGNITEIGRLAFYECRQLTEVTLENGVEEIAQNAFRNCVNDLSVNIPVSLTSISNNVGKDIFNLMLNSNEEIDKFYENEDDFNKVAPFVRKITLGKDVKYIEDDIFADFSYLQAIEVDSNNQDYTSVDGVLYSKDEKTIERYPMDKPDEVFIVQMGVTKIEASAFAGSKNLRAVPMPPTVNLIGARAFKESGISSVSIPSAVREISDGTFEGCEGLGHVQLPEGLQVIGNNAFNGCKALFKYGISGKRGINCPESLKAIGKDAFKGCAQINTNAIPDLPTTYVEEDIVGDVEEKEAPPISTATIDDDDDDSTTNNDKKETKKDKNSKKTRVKQSSRGRRGRKGSTPTRGGARKNIKANKSGDNDGDINLNKNEEDEDIADNNDKKSSKEEKSSNKKRKLIKKKPGRNFITKKTDENKVEKNKAEETIDDSDDDDQKEAQYDKNAKKHRISGTDVFWQFYKETGTLIFSGSGMLSIGDIVYTYLSGKRPWETGDDIKKIIIQEGVTGIANGREDAGMFTACCPNLEEVEIANSVTKIGRGAFSGCTELKTVKLGTGVTEIGEYAFQNCTSLKSINISPSVQTIGNSAFFSCTALEDINIPSSVETIGKRAFNRCHSLSYVTFSGDNPQLKTIPQRMFEDCKALSAIVLPPSVQTIEDEAFPDNVKIIKMPQ